MSKIKAHEAKGVRAIQHLQKMAGIDEPDAKDLCGWRAMSSCEKANTLAAFQLFSPPRDKN